METSFRRSIEARFAPATLPARPRPTSSTSAAELVSTPAVRCRWQMSQALDGARRRRSGIVRASIIAYGARAARPCVQDTAVAGGLSIDAVFRPFGRSHGRCRLDFDTPCGSAETFEPGAARRRRPSGHLIAPADAADEHEGFSGAFDRSKTISIRTLTIAPAEGSAVVAAAAPASGAEPPSRRAGTHSARRAEPGRRIERAAGRHERTAPGAQGAGSGGSAGCAKRLAPGPHDEPLEPRHVAIADGASMPTRISSQRRTRGRRMRTATGCRSTNRCVRCRPGQAFRPGGRAAAG